MRTSIRQKKSFVFITLIITIILFGVSLAAAKSPTPESTRAEIEALLNDYSEYLETGITDQKGNYSSQLEKLVAERQDFYKEFYEKGLHSNLISLDSQYLTDQKMTISQKNDVYQISIVENITMYGKPITKTPSEYPLIQAAQWALSQTDDPAIHAALNEYITSMSAGISESVKNGVKTVFTLEHNIKIKSQTNQLQIIADTFTDKASDNEEGFDNVIWSGDGYFRQKPSWELMIDYAMYNTPIESIGNSLLKDLQPISDKLTTRGIWFSYYRWSARSYANQYSSNPSNQYHSDCGYSLRRDTSKWNPSYSYVWDANSTIRCSNCADFVSQAIRYGGFPTDGTWYPSAWGTWSNVSDLKRYLINNYWGTWFVDEWSINVGELGFVYSGTWDHVVLITQVNPHKYSGHTNDRRDYPLSNSINRFMHIESSLYKY